MATVSLAAHQSMHAASRFTSLDGERLELLAALERGDQPSRPVAASRPGLAAVLRVAIERRQLLALECVRTARADAVRLRRNPAQPADRLDQPGTLFRSPQFELGLDPGFRLDELIECHRFYLQHQLTFPAAHAHAPKPNY